MEFVELRPPRNRGKKAEKGGRKEIDPMKSHLNDMESGVRT